MTDNYGIYTKSDIVGGQLSTETVGFIKNQTGSTYLPSGSGVEYGLVDLSITPIPVVNHYIFAHKLNTSFPTALWRSVIVNEHRTTITVMKSTAHAFTMDWQIASLASLQVPDDIDSYGIKIYNDERRNIININENLQMLKLVHSAEILNPFDDGNPNPTYAYAEDPYNNYFLLTPATFQATGFIYMGNTYVSFVASLMNIHAANTIKIEAVTILLVSGGSEFVFKTNNIGKCKLLEFAPMS